MLRGVNRVLPTTGTFRRACESRPFVSRNLFVKRDLFVRRDLSVNRDLFGGTVLPEEAVCFTSVPEGSIVIDARQDLQVGEYVSAPHSRPRCAGMERFSLLQTCNLWYAGCVTIKSENDVRSGQASLPAALR